MTLPLIPGSVDGMFYLTMFYLLAVLDIALEEQARAIYSHLVGCRFFAH